MEENINALRDYVDEWIDSSSLRDRMNFSFQGNLLDTSDKSISQTLEVFRKLDEQGYLIDDKGTFYLNAIKIRKDFDLHEIAEDISFSSDRTKKEFTRLIDKSDDYVRVTKDRRFSIKNPFSILI